MSVRQKLAGDIGAYKTGSPGDQILLAYPFRLHVLSLIVGLLVSPFNTQSGNRFAVIWTDHTSA